MGDKILKGFTNILNREILKGLPGKNAQWQMASSDRMIKNYSRMPGKNSRIASVLILLYPNKESIYTVFMQRPVYDGIHSGQISFPGGKVEPNDENIIHTALREANEETGVVPEKISVINTLTPLFIPVSNILVTPVVGWTNEKPIFKHQPDEVDFLIEAELKRFMDPDIIRTKPLSIRGKMIDVKYFDYDGHVIWGATAMILNELLIIIKRSESSIF
jgi:8-oxo-dGTP pyrophosphatase MutT (NUDIX family)